MPNSFSVPDLKSVEIGGNLGDKAICGNMGLNRARIEFWEVREVFIIISGQLIPRAIFDFHTSLSSNA